MSVTIDRDLISKKIKYFNALKNNYIELKDSYRENYSSEMIQYQGVFTCDNNGIGFSLDVSGFEDYFSKVLLFIDNQINLLDQVKNMDYEDCQSKLSMYMKNMLDKFLSILNMNYNQSIDTVNFYQILNYPNLYKDYHGILLLNKFAQYDTNIILIGANGSGKSSLANSLKGSDTEFIAVVPAQKNLYFSIDSNLNLLTSNKSELLKLLFENNIGKSKTNTNCYNFYEYSNNQFTRLILEMQNEFVSALCRWESENKIGEFNGADTVFYKLRKVFNTLFPDIELYFTAEKTLYCKRFGNEYTVNGLSEGEKAVIYYTASVLFAKKDSCIIIDEPETYMNPSLTNSMWDLLTDIRSDCQFIFITHNVDFVLGQSNSKIAWIKNFEFPDSWKIEILDEDNELPRTLLTEILGSKKPIVFCEGNDKSSLDYKIYKSIIGDEYTIIPAQGHHQVINFCKAVNNLNIGYDCFGIIDGDNISDDKVKQYEKCNVFVLPFNEIEMLLVENKVMEYVVKSIYPVDYKSLISSFIEDFWKLVDNKKDSIVLSYVKTTIDEKLEISKVQKYKSFQEIRDSLESISNLSVDQIYNTKMNEVVNIINRKDYDSLLKVCNLKKEITCSLATKFFDKNYEEKVRQHIMSNKELQKYLKSKYFHKF